MKKVLEPRGQDRLYLDCFSLRSLMSQSQAVFRVSDMLNIKFRQPQYLV